MSFLKILLFFVMGLGHFVSAQGQISPAKAPTRILWKKIGGETGQWPTSPSELALEDKKILFLPVVIPAATKSVSILSADGEIPVTLKTTSTNKYMLLEQSAGQLQIIDEANIKTNYSFQLSYPRPLMILSPSCQPLNLQVEMLSSNATIMPSLLTCTVSPQAASSNPKKKPSTDIEIQNIIFSTVTNAEWFGAGIFEIEGKGERWKTFAAKDIIALPQSRWEISWGSADKKNVARITVIKPKKPTPPTPKPPLTFWAGAQYLTGTIEKSGVSSPMAGLVIPLEAQYQLEKAWWYLGGSYDFFAYATQKQNGGSNSTSALNLWAGAEYKLTNLAFRADAGYLSRSLDAPGVQTSSSFEALRYRGSAIYNFSNDRSFGFSFLMAQTSAQGQFSENDIGLYYQDKMFLQRDVRLLLTSATLKATSGVVQLKSQWMQFGISLGF